MTEITMRRLIKAGAHFGHQTRYWAPKMAPYIFGDRNKIHIINLEKTLPMLRRAAEFLGAVAARGGKVLFVGTKRQAGRPLREHAIRCGAPYVDHRWLGGMLTNYKTVKNSITRLKDLEQQFETGATARLSKKEALTLERERAKLDRALSGIKDMDGLPDALFIIDVEQEYIAVAEANKLGIPVVAVVDTNCSPDGIDYVIPGNDDSAGAILLYLEAAVNGILEARAKASEAMVAGEDEYLEVDDTGGVIDGSVLEKRAAVVAAKEAATPKLTATGDAGEDAAKTETEPETKPEAKTETTEVTRRKVVRKKVVRKKVIGKKTTARKPAAEKPAVEKTTETKKTTPATATTPAAKTTATTATTAKKATVKKTAAKKTAAKKVAKKKPAAKKAAKKKTAKSKS